ncbi:alpha/beta hydrolase [Rhodococcoides yunnanense]|uniref:Alpha/beta fold hydrolase n=1 Tax=Rhodococcoides yunnanense TaxID=278209 RepID=A0ABU4BKA6_9NOCA|nr:alpha/beta fold hydrolase [Rhodococcus yunnanensis]MDV6264652.1 alpha/beta fold hydrolase [Rhodococcus yunnanensis]
MTAAERTDIRFTSESDECGAWLYLPDTVPNSRPVPIIVMAHGFSGIKELRLDAFAERFHREGYACLVFDYRHFGGSGGEPRELLDIGRQLEDWRNAVAYARSLPNIDPNRVVVWGTSFGGGHAIVTAADDQRIAAAIAQCPFTDGPASALVIPPTTSIRLMARALHDLASAAFHRVPVRVPAAGAPGSAAVMTAPDSQRGFDALLEASDLSDMPQLVPARVMLRVPFHVPGRRTRDIGCPILFTICERDSVAPARAALKHARRAQRGEVRLYDADHFDIYVGEPFEKVVSDQLNFLSAHVPVDSSTSTTSIAPSKESNP